MRLSLFTPCRLLPAHKGDWNGGRHNTSQRNDSNQQLSLIPQSAAITDEKIVTAERLSDQRNEMISDTRSAVAAQVRTSMSCNGFVSLLRVARVCCGVMTTALYRDRDRVFDILQGIPVDALVRDADLIDQVHNAADLSDRRPSHSLGSVKRLQPTLEFQRTDRARMRPNCLTQSSAFANERGSRHVSSTVLGSGSPC